MADITKAKAVLADLRWWVDRNSAVLPTEESNNLYRLIAELRDSIYTNND